MEKFLFIIREDLVRLGTLSEDERYDAIKEMDLWVKTLVAKGNYVGGDALRIKGSYVSKDRVVSDGPFIEAKEGISGFMFMQARDLSDAVSLAQTCTLVKRGDMAIEVRPMMDVKDIRELGDEPRRAGG
ncbi:YciI family protein [Dinghuibacter silviterrae]|uniref:YCII-related domain-containing protein n=1 Tax=Dinghuibacter silviterrae TaxID=1539049 RepID=A0A4R8DI00_9BACT|nr:YciI family protein [Dinghuibacter silviterrae]TDW96570.1 hypothetical protein EDB95_4402 [Dinghuibacter silviterrae]